MSKESSSKKKQDQANEKTNSKKKDLTKSDLTKPGLTKPSLTKSDLDKSDLDKSDFEQKLDALKGVEKKIRFALDEMKKDLLKEDKPDFKNFWMIKNLCLNLFKEKLGNSHRSLLWKEYIEISNEERRIKNILKDEFTFEIEQIDLAITSIEKDKEKFYQVLSTIKEIDLKKNIKTLHPKRSFYLETQKELNLLNAFAAKINSLRKEITKTQMQIFVKNKFLKRLEFLADFIYPKRNELLDSMSEEFSKAIDFFAKDGFDLKKNPFYVLKEEIKNLQNAARFLTLNAQTYTDCRLKLSDCWDKIKMAEQSYKKEKNLTKENVAEVLLKIANLKKICEKSPDEKNLQKEEKEINNFMNTLTLRKEDVKFLKNKIKEAKEPILEKEISIKKDKIQKENEKEVKKKEKLEDIKKIIAKLIENSQLTLDELDQEKNRIEVELQRITSDKFEKLILEKQLRSLYHFIEDKKEKTFSKSNDDLNILQEIFEKKQKRKQDIKNYLDSLNKELACSTLDFEQAMIFREMIDFEKQKLETLNNSLIQLEEKIVNLENN